MLQTTRWNYSTRLGMTIMFALTMTACTENASESVNSVRQQQEGAKSLDSLLQDKSFDTERDTARKIAILDTAAQTRLAAKDTFAYYQAIHKKAALYKAMNEEAASIPMLQALLDFQRKHYRTNISQTAFTIALYYQRIHDTTAFKHSVEAVENLQYDVERTHHHASMYQKLGYLYYDMGKRLEARRCFEKALELASTPPYQDAEKASLAISWIVSCFVIEKRYKEGIAFVKNSSPRYPPADMQGKIYLAQNMLELYMLDGQYNNAEKYANELLGYDSKSGMQEVHRQFTYELVGRLYTLRGKYDDAKYYLLKAYDQAKAQNDIGSLVEDARRLFDVDSAAGRYFDAIGWFQLYKNHLDQKRARLQSNELRKMDIRYETQKKADSLNAMKVAASLQTSLLKQASFVKNLTLALALLLILLLAILFNRFRLKQRTNRQLELNQQKINRQNQELEQLISDERKLLAEKTTLLAEKDWLLKEVHHRVKNNLQIMMSLLETQSMYLQNDALLALEDSQRRIYAMSLIHQKLYQSDDITILEMSRYMREFVNYLKDSFDVSNRIRFLYDLQPVELNVTQAIPIALVVNEVVTNIFKYAFPDGRNGEVHILLKEEGDDIEIQLSDNGVGLPQEVMEGKHTSLGMELIKGLSAEIKGTLLFDTRAGTTITVRFKRTMVNEMAVAV